MNKLLPLNKGYFALIDLEDWERCNKYSWCLNGEGYPVNHFVGLLHHFIVGPPPKGLVTDHLNQNKLDNTRANLRFVTKSINALNRGDIFSHNRNIYRVNSKLQVKFRRNMQDYYVGTFNTLEEAKQARDDALRGFASPI